MPNSNRAFTTLELLGAIAILIFAVFISTSSFKTIARFSSKQQLVDHYVEIESYLSEALLNPNNYKDHAVQLEAGLIPAQIDFYYTKPVGGKTRIASITNSGPTKVFINNAIEECTPPAADCKFFTELEWDTTISQPTIKFLISTMDLNQKNILAPGIKSFTLDNTLYSTLSELKCPSDGQTYLGIRSFDSITRSVVCWRFDTSVTCPESSYPFALKIKAPLSNDLIVDCKPLYQFNCPQGYAPLKAFPLQNASLTNACISIKSDTLSPRFGHLVNEVNASKEGNPSGYYGLKWVKGKLCPAGYELKNNVGYSGNFATDLKNIFQIYDSENKSPCSTQAVCGQNGEDFYCDACPISEASRMQGCASRSFPSSPQLGNDPNCRDPKIYSVESSQLTNFRRNYSCKLKSELQFADGIVMSGAINAN